MISEKCLYLQENFLKDSAAIRLRFLIDKRNLKFDQGFDYSFAS